MDQPRLMIVSDLDGTMVDHKDSLNSSLLRFNALWAAEYSHDSLLVFSSGRSPEFYGELRNQKPLLTPGITILSVGTEIMYGDEMIADSDWELEMKKGWDRSAVVEETSKFSQLTPQNQSEQRPYKVSFKVDKLEGPRIAETLSHRLHARGLRVKLIYSGGQDLDVLPEGAGKGQALSYILRKFSSQHKCPHKILVCGDSGNDADLFSVDGIYGVIVGNAFEELTRWYVENAKDNPQIFRATERCASGILQAMQHFKFLPNISPRDVIHLEGQSVKNSEIVIGREIVLHHLLCERWLKGDIEGSDEVFHHITNSMAADASLVTAWGKEDKLPKAAEILRSRYGIYRGRNFSIWVDRIRAVKLGNCSWLVSFDKWQRRDVELSCRLTTIVFEYREDAMDCIRIHETWKQGYHAGEALWALRTEMQAVYKRRERNVGELQCAGAKPAEDKRVAATKNHKQSWIDRSLSSRRTSILSNYAQKDSSSRRREVPPQPPKSRRPRPHLTRLSKNKVVAPAEFILEKRAHFAEVDAFELEVESPSPLKSKATACSRNLHLQSVPEYALGESEIYSTPEDFLAAALRTPLPRNGKDIRASYKLENAVSSVASQEKDDVCDHLDALSINRTHGTGSAVLIDERSPTKVLIETVSEELNETTSEEFNEAASEDLNEAASEELNEAASEDLNEAASEEFNEAASEEFNETASEVDESISILETLLRECDQTDVMSLSEGISGFCDIENITKIGEGTYGEAFKSNGNVFKIVPMDGNFKVNNEVQKTTEQMYSEVLVGNTLNMLREISAMNSCSSFIQTKASRICRGKYDQHLLHAWEQWDESCSSENDHPSAFPDDQLYTVFVLADGGADLESFVFENFSQVRSLLLQVILALAVAEEECGFEHRDLHWGNIVLARNPEEEKIHFRLSGEDRWVKTDGISASLIDFTLSRIECGDKVLFCDLSADPEIFEGLKKNIQAETYRRMLQVTNGKWEQSFPKTNCLWIHYVVEIVIAKKKFRASAKERGALRGLSKRALTYESAKAMVADEFFYS